MSIKQSITFKFNLIRCSNMTRGIMIRFYRYQTVGCGVVDGIGRPRCWVRIPLGASETATLAQHQGVVWQALHGSTRRQHGGIVWSGRHHIYGSARRQHAGRMWSGRHHMAVHVDSTEVGVMEPTSQNIWDFFSYDSISVKVMLMIPQFVYPYILLCHPLVWE